VSTLLLPYGDGLDRSTGLALVEPSRFSDLRNVVLFDGKAQVRPGILKVGGLVNATDGPLDITTGLQALRREQRGIGVGFELVTKKSHINLLSGVGEVIQYEEEWFTALEDDPVPRPIMADSYSKVFIAHDEPIYARRAATVYYDTVDGVQPLEADLDGGGDAPVRFRGVVGYLNYMVGWGFGTATDPDRSEIVRVSLPGQPLEWQGDHYFQAGVRGEPVICCRKAGDVLAVLKESETYRIVGYDRRTFGIKPADPHFGVAAGRLAVTVGDTLFTWSHEGPRASEGGPSVDLALPLDLNAPSPSDLVSAGLTEDGFATYVPDLRCVLFVFGQLVYCLSLRNPVKPKWSYWELGVPVFCAGTLYSGGATGGGEPPIAYASNLSTVPGP